MMNMLLQQMTMITRMMKIDLLLLEKVKDLDYYSHVIVIGEKI